MPSLPNADNELAQLLEQGRLAYSMARSLALQQLHFGRYASTEEVCTPARHPSAPCGTQPSRLPLPRAYVQLLEAGDEHCAICQEPLLRPVLLDECRHIFCEECILSWSERAADATCPLCRAPIASATGSHGDGSTTLLPQLF